MVRINDNFSILKDIIMSASKSVLVHTYSVIIIRTLRSSSFAYHLRGADSLEGSLALRVGHLHCRLLHSRTLAQNSLSKAALASDALFMRHVRGSQFYFDFSQKFSASMNESVRARVCVCVENYFKSSQLGSTIVSVMLCGNFNPADADFPTVKIYFSFDGNSHPHMIPREK